MIGTKIICRSCGCVLRTRGRGALYVRRSVGVTQHGAHTSDYADMSNDKSGESPLRRNPKVSWGRFVRPGLVGP